MRHRKLSFFLIILSLSLIFTFCACTETPNLSYDDSPHTELLSLLREVSLYGFDEDFSPTGLSPEEIVAALNDPYSDYFTADEFAAYESDLQGNFVGIGVSIVSIQHETLGDVIQILVAFDNSPAKTAGLTSGDILTHVNGVSIHEVGYDEATNILLGEAGSPVTITYVRDGTSNTITITRAACVKQTVFHSVFLHQNNIPLGYVRITDFDAVTTSQFISAIEVLKSQNVQGIVFDLRYNGGGYLRTVCEMLAYLLPDGDLCTVDYKSNQYDDNAIYAQNGKLYMSGGAYTKDTLGNPINASHVLDMPMAVLTNGSTASAAELFTAALRDYANAGLISSVTIVGETTYGKGCMQTTYKLSDGSYVKVTIALYNPPLAENYDGIGVTPNIPQTGSPSFVDLYLTPEDADPVRDAAFNALLKQLIIN